MLSQFGEEVFNLIAVVGAENKPFGTKVFFVVLN